MNKKVLIFVVLLSICAIALSTSVTPAVGSVDESVRVWVEYRPGQSAAVRASLERARAQFHYTFSDLDSYVVSLPKSALNGILRNPNVVGVEEDVKRFPIAAFPSTVSAALSSDVMSTGGQTVPWGIDAVQARDVWDTNRDGVVDPGAPTGAGRTVCIIDSGYYQAHEDLPNAKGGYSQVDDNWARDGLGHGTHVAGTINALNNEIGVVGVSPGDISLYIIKIFNDDGVWTNSSDLVDAINRCANNGANVISMSLGGGRSNVRERRAFDNLYSQGILHVAAAGNAGNTSHSYPASYDSVISVAAVDENLTVAEFSQQTNQVELAAPGVDVLSTVPFLEVSSVAVDGVTYAASHIENAAFGTASGALVDGGLCTSTGGWSGKVVLCARGEVSFYDKVMNVQNSGGAAALIYNNEPGGFLGTLGDATSTIIALSLSQEDGQYLVAYKLGASATVSSSSTKPASGYEAWNGTSMATPHVAGVAALIWSYNTSLTNVDIRNAMTSTALDLGDAGRDNAYGYGLVQAKAALLLLQGEEPDTPPSVSITNPADGATVSGTVTVTANANDDNGVTQVEFFVGTTSIGVDTEWI
jgi:serine protease